MGVKSSNLHDIDRLLGKARLGRLRPWRALTIDYERTVGGRDNTVEFEGRPWQIFG